MNPSLTTVSAFVGCVLAAVVLVLVGGQKRIAGWLNLGFTVITSALVLSAVGVTLSQGPGEPLTVFSLPSFGYALRIYVDGLSAIFLALIAIIAIASSLFSLTFLDQYPDYSARRYYPNLQLFIASMYGLTSTTDTMFFFFIFWQLMTLSSFALIRFEHRRPESVRAAYKYLIMMQAACALSMIGAGILAPPQAVALPAEILMRFDFDAIQRHLPEAMLASPIAVATAFLLLLIGFGIKAGMWPFGTLWVPDADASAPPPIGALLSGVTLKMGVYGLMRFFLWLVPPEAQGLYPGRSWGLALVLLGTITLLLGTLQALNQENALRLLAFHSIGQTGYILLSLGACLMLLNLPASERTLSLATAAFVGALFHAVNHGLFKSLLFLNAGSASYARRDLDLNKLGGLMQLMPLIGITALVGAFSISGVPLFNGFASKWTIYSACLQSGAATKILPFCAWIAILTSALTLASFIKFFGTIFLSRVSADAAQNAAPVSQAGRSWNLLLPQVMLALFCLGFGLFPNIAYQLFQSSLNHSQQGYGIVLAGHLPTVTGAVPTLQISQASFSPILLGLWIGLLFLLGWGLAKLGGATRRLCKPWLCGYAQDHDRHRYSAHHLYSPLKRYAPWINLLAPGEVKSWFRSRTSAARPSDPHH
jgi:hydrogenase-4 component B